MTGSNSNAGPEQGSDYLVAMFALGMRSLFADPGESQEGTPPPESFAGSLAAILMASALQGVAPASPEMTRQARKRFLEELNAAADRVQSEMPAPTVVPGDRWLLPACEN